MRGVLGRATCRAILFDMTPVSPALFGGPLGSGLPVAGLPALGAAESTLARPIAIVGMMGAGKTVVGRRLAVRLGLGFIDSDHEIEACARASIAELFARHGEAYFRDREAKVVSRLVTEGRRVIATGGGAFMHPATRALLKACCLTVWLKADAEVLMRRVRKRPNRPLLQTPDPEATLRHLMDIRYPVYAEADLTVVSRDGPHEQVVDDVLEAIEARSRQGEGVGDPR